MTLNTPCPRGNLSCMLMLVTINQSTVLEMTSFTHFRDKIGAPKFKSGSCVPDMHIWGLFVILKLILGLLTYEI